jgi:hypothetical protein
MGYYINSISGQEIPYPESFALKQVLKNRRRLPFLPVNAQPFDETFFYQYIVFLKREPPEYKDDFLKCVAYQCYYLLAKLYRGGLIKIDDYQFIKVYHIFSK